MSPSSVPIPALLEADLVRGYSKLPCCLLSGLCFRASAYPVPPVRILTERVIRKASFTLPRPLRPQPPSLSHLPGGNCWVMDGDKVGGDPVAPPQLPRDAPVSANSKAQSGCSVCVLPLAALPTQGPYTPDVVHPRMPRPLMGLRQYTEVTPGHSSTGSLSHLSTAHVPLRP